MGLSPAFRPLLLMGFFRPFVVMAAMATWLPLPVTIACIQHDREKSEAVDNLKVPFDISASFNGLT